MTEIADDTVRELLALIDRGLGELSDRQLMATSEVADLLLDVRLLLLQAEVEAAAVPG